MQFPRVFAHNRRMSQFIKIYVCVAVEFSAEGKMKPLYIEWENGRRYYVDRVGEVKYAPAHVGAEIPVRFACEISGFKRYLYYEDTLKKWFVEKEIN